MAAYKLKGVQFGESTVLASYPLNKYRRNILKCRCGYVFERNNNKLMKHGEAVRHDVCPACRRLAARKTMAGVYRSGYLWKRWEYFIRQAYADIDSSARTQPGSRILIDDKCRDFFKVFARIKDRSYEGYSLKLKRAAYTLKPENLVWTRGQGADRDVKAVEVL